MHTAKTARRALDLLWNNYLTLGDQVDLEMMLPERIDNLYDQNADARPYWIAAWLLRQGHFISAWSFWEYYARGLCQSLPNKKTNLPRESSVDWIGRSLLSNDVDFSDKSWFASANCLRNLIAHNGARVDGPKAQNNLTRAGIAFPGIATWRDGYVDIEHSHLADLQCKIEDFVDETSVE
jgi:hypothetical protein